MTVMTLDKTTTRRACMDPEKISRGGGGSLGWGGEGSQLLVYSRQFNFALNFKSMDFFRS